MTPWPTPPTATITGALRAARSRAVTATSFRSGSRSPVPGGIPRPSTTSWPCGCSRPMAGGASTGPLNEQHGGDVQQTLHKNLGADVSHRNSLFAAIVVLLDDTCLQRGDHRPLHPVRLRRPDLLRVGRRCLCPHRRLVYGIVSPTVSPSC